MKKIYYLTGNVPKKHMNDAYYFDNNSTTLIHDKNVLCGITDWVSCGNPSNTLHNFGRNASNKLKQCRHAIAKDMNIRPCELYFTSGATESNNIVIQGILKHYLNTYPEQNFTAITSSFEHSSVLNVFKYYSKNPRLEIIYIHPCKDKTSMCYGRIDSVDVQKAIDNAKYKIVLASIMHANNETGAIQDLWKIGNILTTHNIFYHSDITQSLGKFIIKPALYGLAASSFSGHKFHGPKGIGGLYINKKYSTILNLCYGGGQESHLRPGTENVANIVGMTMALEKTHENRDQKNDNMLIMKKYVIDNLNNHLDIMVLSPKIHCLPNTIYIAILDMNICNRTLVRQLSDRNIYISVGSACQTNSSKSSHVLASIGVDTNLTSKVIRISLSDYNTIDQCRYLVGNIIDIIKNIGVT